MKSIITFLFITCVYTSIGLAQVEIASTNDSGPLTYGTKNAILVPMELESTGWDEFAYMAAVPAGRKINSDGMPSIIALPGDGSIDKYIGSNGIPFHIERRIMATAFTG